MLHDVPGSSRREFLARVLASSAGVVLWNGTGFGEEGAMAAARDYPLRDFSSLRGLRGIPDALVEAHLKLYAGYVKNLNLLTRGLSQLRLGSPEWTELKRRQGFEVNGARLHELYFENLTPAKDAPPSALRDAISGAWGTFDAWREEFTAMGVMRGVGWVILYRDPVGGTLGNYWITLHEQGHPAGFTPLLVMDVWEHAFTGLERPRYVDAFLDNVSWRAVEARSRASAVKAKAA